MASNNGGGGSAGEEDPLLAELDAAMARGCDFLRRNLPQHAGTWLGGPQNAAVTLTGGAHMVLPLAYTAAGRRADAVAAMARHIVFARHFSGQ